MKKEYELIKLNEKNLNNRIYTKESFKNIPEIVPVYFERNTERSSEPKDLQYVVGFANNIKIDNRVVKATIEFNDKRLNDLVNMVNKGVRLFCTTTGNGEIEPLDDCRHVKNYTLECIDIQHDSSFKGLKNKITFDIGSRMMETE